MCAVVSDHMLSCLLHALPLLGLCLVEYIIDIGHIDSSYCTGKSDRAGHIDGFFVLFCFVLSLKIFKVNLFIYLHKGITFGMILFDCK